MASGMQLSGMEASDMLDILHYYFEEDSFYISEDHMNTRSKSREAIYRNLYDKEYKYKVKGNTAGSGNTAHNPEYDLPFDTEEESIKPFDPLAAPTKAFVPATDFNPEATNPFNGVLDAPLG